MQGEPPTSVVDPDVLDRLLDRVRDQHPDLPAIVPPLRVDRLTGGYHNTVVRVRDGGAVDWVVKQYVTGSTNPLYPQLDDHEALAMRVLAASGTAPELVAHVTQGEVAPVVVYGWVDGPIWDGDLVGAAEVLAAVHAVPVPTGAAFRRLAVTSDELLAHADAMLRHASPFHAAAVRRCARAVPTWTGRADALVHTDCGPGNMVQGADRVRLIDWQCPGVGDAVEDLAVFVSPAMQILYGRAPLEPAEREAFLDAYDGAAAARLEVCGPAHHVRIAAYCAFRIVELAESSPTVSARYAEALAAEVSWLEHRLGLGPDPTLARPTTSRTSPDQEDPA